MRGKQSLPPELQRLIEKRDQEEDRRQQEQRGDGDQRQVDLGPEKAAEANRLGERRGGEDRRDGDDRRTDVRRSEDRDDR